MKSFLAINEASDVTPAQVLFHAAIMLLVNAADAYTNTACADSVGNLITGTIWAEQYNDLGKSKAAAASAASS